MNDGIDIFIPLKYRRVLSLPLIKFIFKTTLSSDTALNKGAGISVHFIVIAMSLLSMTKVFDAAGKNQKAI